MTDIAKCEGIECDKKDSCYRYTCPASAYQSYFRPSIPEICGYFIDNKERQNERTKRASPKRDAREETREPLIPTNEAEDNA